MTKLDESMRTAIRLAVLAATVTIGPQTYAEVIRFNNPDSGEPGHFDWDWGGEFDATTWLDITSPSTDQGRGVGPSSVGQVNHQSGAFNITTGGAAVFRAAASAPPWTMSLSAGSTIDGQLYFGTDTWHASDPPDGDPISSLFESGVRQYIGVRVSDIDGYHYGWIGVVRQDMDFDAFAWAYETEPGVPIIAGIPAPGTLAALAFGAAVTRRKRKDD
jgi:hypothetical protein